MGANSGTAVSTDAGACVVAGDGTVDCRSGAVGSGVKHAAGWVFAKDSGFGEDDDIGGSYGDVRDGTDSNCPQAGTTEKAEKGTGSIAAKTCSRRGRGGVPSPSPRLAEVSPCRFALPFSYWFGWQWQ
jgi:hypothetical protein